MHFIFSQLLSSIRRESFRELTFYHITAFQYWQMWKNTFLIETNMFQLLDKYTLQFRQVPFVPFEHHSYLKWFRVENREQLAEPPPS